MSTPYTVKSGDWLQKIAEQHGFAHYTEIYNHPDNAAFRQKRPDPNKIFPGDIIMIPDKEDPGGGTPGKKPKEKPKETGEDTICVAAEFDTLCSIAVEHGFADCLTLRNHPPNKEFKTRPLKAGDEVHVPAKTEGTSTGETEKRHEHVRKDQTS